MSTTLLLADDSATIAKILGMALQNEAIEIRAVQTAAAAKDALRALAPTFFLVDLTLPEMDGYEFARYVRAEPGLEEVKIMLLSSAFEPVDEALFEACGAHAVLAKPFDPEELRTKLRGLSELIPGYGISTLPADLLSDPSSLLDYDEEEDGPSGGDADSILNALLHPEASEVTAPSPLETLDLSVLNLGDSPLTADPEPASRADATVAIDMHALAIMTGATEEPVLDLSSSWKTPPGGTALLDLFSAPVNEAPPAAPQKAAAPAPAPQPESLSANAQALAAFFAAEIDSHAPPSAPPAKAPPAAAPAPPTASEDSFDASLSSIDWGGPAEDNLNAWSAPPPKKSAAPKADAPPSAPPRAPAPAPSAPAARPAAPAPASAPNPAPARPAPGSGASSDRGSFLFDTGGSNFRFAEDYVARITRSFTGAVDEMILGKEASATTIFPQSSHDEIPVAIPGAPPRWTSEDMKRIEAMVREEVQAVVREMVEKVAWEVIPELAENLIRKQLDQVLKEIE